MPFGCWESSKGPKIQGKHKLAITKFLIVFISAVLMCEQSVMQNTVVGLGTFCVFNLWVINTIFCVEKNACIPFKGSFPSFGRHMYKRE